jgi:glycerophosphoryl diester phosphodiesterase
VYINSPKQFKEWREVAPSVPLMVSLPNKIKTAEELIAFLNNTKPDILDGSYRDYTEEFISVANRMQIPVWPDIQSVDEEKNWKDALKLKFQGMQTDHPELLMKYLKKQRIN